jgi:hypothetical protein
VIAAPQFSPVRSGVASPVKGVSVSDREARASDVFGLLLVSRAGKASLGAVPGLRFLTPNGARFVAVSGTLQSINAALGSLTFTPDGPAARYTLSLFAADLGHGQRLPAQRARRDVILQGS